MKKIITFLLILGCMSLNAQNSADKFTTGSSDQPRDPRVDQMNFVPNEVLVKFKDEVPLSSAARLRSAGLSAVDKVLQANGIDSLVRLFPNTKNSLLRSTGVARVVKDPQGRDMKIPNLDKIYKITLPQLRSTSSVPVNIFQVIEDLKALPEVEYVEPNYIYSVDDLQPVGPVFTADDVKKMQSGLRSSQAAVVPNDPLYSQQWYIPAVKADLVWEQTTGDTTQVIGILDTGVDWNHPDLKNKIWTNPGEIPGNGIDDDGDGLIDDIRGWDYINNDNNPMDDNSHGTHVTGIAAAETNNGIGIAGVCPKAKIMPIKVFQSSGRGDAATITKGIIYAATHGATVINMSFGSYSRSLTMEDALANAYATSILVAAAGNDGIDIESRIPPGRFYPAALSYVLGVMAPEASFSNKDNNGPTFSTYDELNNYELKAPGTNIISTIPNGNYRVYQGTSMAAPIVSGAVALYNSVRSKNESDELMWVKLIQSTSIYLDINTMINLIPKSEVRLISQTMVDSIPGDDNDGRVDAGETIQFWFTARNTGGQCDSTWFKLRLHEFEDTTTVKIIKPISFIGSMSSYAMRTSQFDPMKIQISSNVINNRDIVFDLLMWYKNSPDTTIQQVVLNVENGVQLSGVLTDTLKLSSNKLWLVNNSFKISPSGVLILSPGTKMILSTLLINDGKIIGKGTSDSIITIKGTAIMKSWGSGPYGNLDLQYCNLDLGIGGIEGAIYYQNGAIKNSILSIHRYITGNLYFVDCVFKNCDGGLFTGIGGGTTLIENTTFDNCTVPIYFSNGWAGNFSFKQCNFSNFQSINLNDNSQLDFSKCNILDNYQKVALYAVHGYVQELPNQYWGTGNPIKISKKLFDFYDDPFLSQLKFAPFLNAPDESTHAIVWKILVNGKDAQDEVVDPIGVGKQRFDVYFNRSMDKTVTPQVSFGVRLPYSQQSVNEDGSWSADGRIYTAYKSIKLTTGDGINRIRVAGAKETNGWEHEIPIEDQRFNLLISAASSSSLDFMATPGLGKVKLEWNNNDLEDGLGYNMYRMEHINDSTLTSPVIINTSLISDTLYTDYSVTPNKKYYYFYKIVRTDLSETDSSKVVSAIPFTAAKGDANGDLSVNVLDITTIVAYLLNNNPQPFIAEAADMNSDGNINVLDIVGVVNQVLYGGLRSTSTAEDQQVSLYLQNDTLFADATTAIGGLQFDVSGVTSINDIQVLNALQMFESGYSQRDSTTLRLLYYSMSGKSIAAGSRIPLLKLKKDCSLKDVIVSDKAGAAIPVSLTDPTIGNRNGHGRMVAELGQNYPNPSKGQTTLPVQIFEKVDEAAINIYNMLGQQVKVIKLDNPTVGKHEVQWNSLKDKGLFIYKLEIRSGGQQYVSPLKKMIAL